MDDWIYLYTMMQAADVLLLMSMQFSFWQVSMLLQDINIYSTTKYLLSPCFRVDMVSVHVIHQAVFVVGERLVSPVDKHTAAGLVVHAAVAVTSLDHRASSRHNLPRVRP